MPSVPDAAFTQADMSLQQSSAMAVAGGMADMKHVPEQPRSFAPPGNAVPPASTLDGHSMNSRGPDAPTAEPVPVDMDIGNRPLPFTDEGAFRTLNPGLVPVKPVTMTGKASDTCLSP